MGIQRKMSTAFHPQTNGQTERANQTLEEYLRHYVTFNQDNWVACLPMAQFAFNSSVHEATGLTPYFANYGRELTAYHEPEERTEGPTPQELAEIHRQLHQDLKFVSLRMAHYYNKKRSTEPILGEGDKVFLIRRNIKSRRPNQKLDHVKLGPFKIKKKLGKLNYEVELPDQFGIHPVFHIAMLEPAPKDMPVSKEWGQITNTQDGHNVERILGERVVNTRLYYLVEWKNHTNKQRSWEPANHLLDARNAINEYNKTPRKQVNSIQKRGLPVAARNLETRLENIRLTIRDLRKTTNHRQFKELQEQWEEYVELQNEYQDKTQTKKEPPSYHKTEMEDIIRIIKKEEKQPRQIRMMQTQNLSAQEAECTTE